MMSPPTAFRCVEVARIEDLDEFQGLTPQMVREWLREQGFDMRIGGLLHAGRYLVEWEPIESAWRSTEASLYAVAQYRNQSVQSLLREINPRMRKGMPSRAALEAHGENGDWVVFRNVLHAVRFVWTVCDVVQMVSGFDVFRSDNPEDAAMIAECSFWPCDKHGNKVRWPEQDGGML